jgi:hypothetical protein
MKQKITVHLHIGKYSRSRFIKRTYSLRYYEPRKDKAGAWVWKKVQESADLLKTDWKKRGVNVDEYPFHSLHNNKLSPSEISHYCECT